MKKINLAWPVVISIFITLISALLTPGISEGNDIYYGFPVAFLKIFNEPLNPGDILFSRIGINILDFFSDMVVYAVLIWLIILVYRKIKMKEKATVKEV